MDIENLLQFQSQPTQTATAFHIITTLMVDPDPYKLYGNQGSFVFKLKRLSRDNVPFDASDYDEAEQRSGPFCPVCLETFTDCESFPVETECGHILCRDCLLESLNRTKRPFRNTCPVCRHPIYPRPSMARIRICDIVAELADMGMDDPEMRARVGLNQDTPEGLELVTTVGRRVEEMLQLFRQINRMEGRR
jgi:hypothetical protein